MPFWENFVPPKLTSSICKKILFRRLRILSWISCSSILAKSCTVSGPSIIQKLHSKHNKWTNQHSWTTFKIIHCRQHDYLSFFFNNQGTFHDQALQTLHGDPTSGCWMCLSQPAPDNQGIQPTTPCTSTTDTSICSNQPSTMTGNYILMGNQSTKCLIIHVNCRKDNYTNLREGRL